MKDIAWALALKPGDKAALQTYFRGYGEPYAVLTFSRATATQFVFDEGTPFERRVNKSDMRVRGASTSARVEPYTEAVGLANLRYQLCRDICNIKVEQLRDLTLNELGIIHNIVCNKVAP